MKSKMAQIKEAIKEKTECSAAQIAREYGCSRQLVHSIMEASGVPAVKTKADKVREFYAANPDSPLKEVAEKFGYVSVSHLKNVLFVPSRTRKAKER